MVPVATIRWQEPPFRQGLLRQAAGEHSGARPQPQTGGEGAGVGAWFPPRCPSLGGPGKSLSPRAGSVTWPAPPGRALEYLCGGSPRSGPGPPHTRTAARGPGARGPSDRLAPGTRSGSRQSTSLGGLGGHSELLLPARGRHPAAPPPRSPVPQSWPVKAAGQVQWYDSGSCVLEHEPPWRQGPEAQGSRGAGHTREGGGV